MAKYDGASVRTVNISKIAEHIQDVSEKKNNRKKGKQERDIENSLTLI